MVNGSPSGLDHPLLPTSIIYMYSYTSSAHICVAVAVHCDTYRQELADHRSEGLLLVSSVIQVAVVAC
jgi:hypothetical protein